MPSRIYENFSNRKFTWSNADWRSINSGAGMQSRAIGHSQQSWTNLSFYFPSDGKMGFYYQVSSESGYDFFTFQVDGSQKIRISGESGKRYAEFVVTKGKHVFNFGYSKDGSVVRGWDAVQITDLFVEYNAVEPVTTQITPNPLHKGNIRLTAGMQSTEVGKYTVGAYRVLVGGVKAYPRGAEEYTELKSLPFDIDISIDGRYFKIGTNTVVIETTNELSEIGIYEYTVAKANEPPTADVEIKGDKLYATIRDADGDAVQYRISLNGVSVFPDSGYSDFVPDGTVAFHTMPKDVLIIGKTNTLRIDLIDELGVMGSATYTFTGDYAGLLFCDALGTYYSDNIGTILKLLDMGLITSSQTSIPARVYLKNNLGFPVRKVRLWMQNIDLDETVSASYLSFSDSPFEPQSELLFPDAIQHGEVVSFYVAVQSLLQAVHGGMFDIYVDAEPDY